MATSETTNLQLVKYGAGTDNFIRTDYNGNLDKIDTFAGNTNEAIAELMKNSSSGGVDLGAYTSSNNKYTFPNDGYLMFNSGSVSSGKISVNIYTSNDKALFYYMNIATTYQVDMIFMKKGMKCYIDNKPAGTSISFMPLDA